MRSNSLVSVVIVAYNNWPDLELAIQSALNQSYKEIEVIVIDNSSTDETARLVPELFGNRIRYERQPNTGEGGGRNAGVRLSKGEFIQFLDGDDFLAPDKVEKQLTMLEQEPDVDVAFGDFRQFQSAAGRANWEDWDGRDYPDMLATLLSPEGNGCGLVVHSLLFRRRAVDVVGPWAENSPVSEGAVKTNMADQDYWLRAAWAGCRFKYCPGSWCFQRKRSGQISSNLRGVVRGMESVLTKAQQYIVREPYRTAVSRQLGRTLFYLAVSERDSSVRDSLAQLRKARELSSDFVTLRLYVCGALLIVTGLGPSAFSNWLKPFRQLGAAVCGTKK